MEKIDLPNIGLSGRNNRNDTNHNFAQIQQAFNSNVSEIDKRFNDTNNSIDKQITGAYAKLTETEEKWLDRAKRISIGTDNETIRIVVEQILKEKGLI